MGHGSWGIGTAYRQGKDDVAEVARAAGHSCCSGEDEDEDEGVEGRERGRGWPRGSRRGFKRPKGWRIWVYYNQVVYVDGRASAVLVLCKYGRPGCRRAGGGGAGVGRNGQAGRRRDDGSAADDGSEPEGVKRLLLAAPSAYLVVSARRWHVGRAGGPGAAASGSTAHSTQLLCTARNSKPAVPPPTCHCHCHCLPAVLGW